MSQDVDTRHECCEWSFNSSCWALLSVYTAEKQLVHILVLVLILLPSLKSAAGGRDLRDNDLCWLITSS